MIADDIRKHAAILDANGRDGSALEQCADEIDRLRDALESIALYGSDTLSGRTNAERERTGQSYSEWIVEGVREMRDRAMRALEDVAT